MSSLQKTKLSLYYLASYLSFGGLAFLLVPDIALQLFFSTGTYSEVMVRFVGALLLSLGILIIQMIRYDITELYSSTLIVRSFLLVAIFSLYIISNDPMMIILLLIVGLGFVLTSTSYILDRKSTSPS